MAAKKTAKKKPQKKPRNSPKQLALHRRTKKRLQRAVQLSIPVDAEPETMTEVEVETEKKLSAKIIVGKRIGKIDAPKDLFTVIGIATGTKTGQSNYGEWVGLRGQFEVTRCDDGKVLHAPLMILPDLALALIPFYMLPCEFAFLVKVVPSANGAGFEYAVDSIVTPRPHDPLAELRRSLFIDGRTGPA
jgi:hypothetical protein